MYKNNIIRTCLSLVFWFFGLVLIVGNVTAQQSGIITYYKKYHWSNIATKMPFLSTEEKDRILLTWGESDETYKGEPYLLTFNEEGSVYKAGEKEENHGYSWGEDEDIFIRFSADRTTRDNRELLGKLWLIEDDIPRYKWKMLNEMKEVAGYLCMKAEAKDTVLDITITAWYTDKIKVVSGPEGFSGLPGLILALQYNGDDVTIEASKVELTDVDKLPLPEKVKGKKTTYEDYNARRKKHITLSIAGKRNPFWEIRY